MHAFWLGTTFRYGKNTCIIHMKYHMGLRREGGVRCTVLLVPVLRCIDRDADQTVLYTARGHISTLYGKPIRLQAPESDHTVRLRQLY